MYRGAGDTRTKFSAKRFSFNFLIATFSGKVFFGGEWRCSYLPPPKNGAKKIGCKHSLLYLRKPKGSGFFFKPFWLPFLHLGPAQVTPRELVYRLVAIVKSLGFGIFISILMLFYRYKCSRGRNGRFDCYRPDVFFIVYFVHRIFLICHKTWPSG